MVSRSRLFYLALCGVLSCLLPAGRATNAADDPMPSYPWQGTVWRLAADLRVDDALARLPARRTAGSDAERRQNISSEERRARFEKYEAAADRLSLPAARRDAHFVLAKAFQDLVGDRARALRHLLAAEEAGIVQGQNFDAFGADTNRVVETNIYRLFAADGSPGAFAGAIARPLREAVVSDFNTIHRNQTDLVARQDTMLAAVHALANADSPRGKADERQGSSANWTSCRRRRKSPSLAGAGNSASSGWGWNNSRLELQRPPLMTMHDPNIAVQTPITAPVGGVQRLQFD